MSAPRAPQGLGAAGRALWRRLHADGLTYRADEVEVLREAARTADVVARLEEALVDVDVIVPGSRGQDALHPAVAELRLQRQLLAQLLGKLDVPEEAEALEGEWDGLSATDRARKAARARWG